MREFKSSVFAFRLLASWAGLLLFSACSIPLGEVRGSDLKIALVFPSARSILTPETNHVEVTVTSKAWGAPRLFAFSRGAESTMALTIPGVPVGEVTVDVVAGIGSTQLDEAVSGAHAVAVVSASSAVVSLSLLPVAPTVQTAPIAEGTDIESLGADWHFDAVKTKLFQVKPAVSGLYRLAAGPIDGAELPPAFAQVYDAGGTAVAAQRTELGEGVTLWFVRLDAGQSYYAALRAATGTTDSVFFFDEAAHAGLTTAVPAPEGELDAADTLLFTFPSAMDTSASPGLTVLDSNKNEITGISVTAAWLSPTQLQISCPAGWPTGEVSYVLTNLKGSGLTNTVTAGRMGDFLLWKRHVWNSLYVDPVSGSDANTGKLRSAPAKSLNKFFTTNLSSATLSDAVGSGARGVRILIAKSSAADNAHNALQAGTTWLKYDTDQSGIALQGGRDPSNHWNRVAGAYSYLGFDGDNTAVDSSSLDTVSLNLRVSTGSDPVLLEGLAVVRLDQSGSFTTPTTPDTPSFYRMTKVWVDGTSTSKAVIRDNLFDAGYLHYTASVGNAHFVSLNVFAPQATISRNTIRNRASALTDAGAYATFLGLWLYHTNPEAASWIVANNTVEPGGLDGPVVSSNGGSLGIWVSSPGQPVYVANNTVLVPAGQSNQTNGTREGIRGTANNAPASTWVAVNNLVVFLESPSLWFHQYVGTSGTSYSSINSVKNNLFATDSPSDPDFGGPSGYPSSTAFFHNGTAYQTISALNSIGTGYGGNALSSWSEVAPLSATTDFKGGLQPGGFALQPGSITTVKDLGDDLSTLAAGFDKEDEAAFVLDRLGNPHTLGGWSIGAYEQD